MGSTNSATHGGGGRGQLVLLVVWMIVIALVAHYLARGGPAVPI